MVIPSVKLQILGPEGFNVLFSHDSAQVHLSLYGFNGAEKSPFPSGGPWISPTLNEVRRLTNVTEKLH